MTLSMTSLSGGTRRHGLFITRSALYDYFLEIQRPHMRIRAVSELLVQVLYPFTGDRGVLALVWRVPVPVCERGVDVGVVVIGGRSCVGAALSSDAGVTDEATWPRAEGAFSRRSSSARSMVSDRAKEGCPERRRSAFD